MKFSYSWLQSYFKENLPAQEKLAEALTMHSFETEVTENGDLEIDITPNRAPDASAHLGIAREISTILGLELTVPEFEPKTKDGLKTEDFVVVEVEDKESCPRYMALLVCGIKVGPSPDWLAKRLGDIGQKSINNIVDAANYVMLETGQPLHAFDLDKLGKKKIVVRTAREGEEIETLDDRQVKLPLDSLVIADGDEPLAIAGIKGGKKAEITNDTKDIIIEAAVFSGPGIRRTSQAISLQTDASFRFEHGISCFLPETAIKRIAALVCELAGGEMAESTIDVLGCQTQKNPVIFNTKDVARVLGKEMTAEEIEKILKSLNFTFKKDGENYFVTSPPERTDINIKEDVVEEIIRIFGYENISSEIPEALAVRPTLNEDYVYANWIRGVLSSLGFAETYNYSFGKTGRVELANPQSSKKKYLRRLLSPGLRTSVTENFKNFDTVRLFEIGKVFDDEEGETMSVAITVSYKKESKDTGAELKGAADALFVKEASGFIKENVFEISLEQIIAGAKEHGLDLADVSEFTTEDVIYQPFSKYPAVVRDISLFVPTDTKIEEVARVIAVAGGELLIDTDLFDEYTPPDGDRTSFAFRLVFQSFEKTLTDKEVNQIMDQIIKILEENSSWEVRK